MSEKNNIFENDLLMRTILESGQEEVPAHIWNGVSNGLNKASGKKAILLWSRVAVSVAAVAAAVASVFVFTGKESTDMVPAAVYEDMIAVVEPQTVTMEEIVDIEEIEIVSKTSGARLMAYAPDVILNDSEPVFVTTETKETKETKDTKDTKVSGKAQEPAKEEPKEYFPTIWEEEAPSRKVRTSLVISGITEATGSRSNSGAGIQKAPALIPTPVKTGIKEKNTPSRYGLPLSFGAGVKIEFTPKWSLGVGLNYTYLTRTFDGTYTHVAASGIIDNLVTSDIRNSQHYIGIPVNAYYNIIDSRHVNFYAYAGGAIEKCIYDKYRILSSSILHTEPVKGVQLSANLGFGAEFMLGKHLGLYIDPSLRYYFDCGQPKSIRTEHPLMLGFELGFRFRL